MKMITMPPRNRHPQLRNPYKSLLDVSEYAALPGMRSRFLDNKGGFYHFYPTGKAVSWVLELSLEQYTGLGRPETIIGTEILEYLKPTN